MLSKKECHYKTIHKTMMSQIKNITTHTVLLLLRAKQKPN